jgi:hypothetical protein
MAPPHHWRRRVNREQLAHVLRSAATIAADPDILVVGSQAILGTYDHRALPDGGTGSSCRSW